MFIANSETRKVPKALGVRLAAFVLLYLVYGFLNDQQERADAAGQDGVPGIMTWLARWQDTPLPPVIDLQKGFAELTLEAGYDYAPLAAADGPEAEGDADYALQLSAAFLDGRDLPVRYRFAWAHAAELRDSPDARRIAVALFSGAESDPEMTPHASFMRLVLPGQSKILEHRFRRDPVRVDWTPSRVFAVSGDGRWARLTSSASPATA